VFSPRLPFLSKATSRQPLDAALSYGVGLQWPVLPGCDQGRKGRRCGLEDCLVAAPHPVTGRVGLLPSADEQVLRRWWRRGPHAPVLLAVGHRFDLVDIPAAITEAVLESLRGTGYRLGPVACTTEGRLLIWIRPGAEHPPLPGGLDLRIRTLGDYVTAPPFGGTWVVAPVPLCQPTLPHPSDVLPAVARVCAALPVVEELPPVTRAGDRAPQAARPRVASTRA
jgi:hypothetical protein